MKLVSVVVPCLLLAGITPNIRGQVFVDGFESNGIGSFPVGWSVTYGGANQSVVASPVHAGSRAFRLQAAPFSAAESTVPANIPAGSWTFSGSLRLDSATTAPSSGDALARVETGSKQVTFAIHRPAGAWVLSADGTSLGAALVDHWYNFRIDYRAPSDRYDVYVDGSLVATNVAPSAHTAAPGIVLHAGAINAGTLVAQFDDLRVESIPCATETGLVAYLPFDGSAQDVGPSHFPVASSGGPTFVQGHSGGAVEFDGVNDHLIMLHSGLPVDFDTDAFSVSFWAWIDPNQNQFYFMQERYGANTSAISSGGCMSCDTLQWGGVWYEPGPAHVGAYAQTTGLQSLAGAWHHLAFVYEHLSVTNGNLKLYVDGSLAATTPRLPNPFTPPPPGLVIGAGQNEAMGNFFKGKLDSRIYNRSLSAAEVAGLATAPVIVRGPVDVASWNGHAAMFAVHATGSGQLTYQWRRNGVPIGDGPQFRGTQSPALLIGSPSALLSGDYDVVVSNGAAQIVSSSASLTAGCSRVDVGAQGGIAVPDGNLDNNDFIVFIDQFFAGCP